MNEVHVLMQAPEWRSRPSGATTTGTGATVHTGSDIVRTLAIVVIDGVHGQEIDDVNVTLERHVNGFWETVPLLRNTGSVPVACVRYPSVGSYRLSLDTAAFYAAQGSTPPLTGSVVTFWLAAVARSCTLMVTVTGHTQFSAFCWND